MDRNRRRPGYSKELPSGYCRGLSQKVPIPRLHTADQYAYTFQDVDGFRFANGVYYPYTIDHIYTVDHPHANHYAHAVDDITRIAYANQDEHAASQQYANCNQNARTAVGD